MTSIICPCCHQEFDLIAKKQETPAASTPSPFAPSVPDVHPPSRRVAFRYNLELVQHLKGAGAKWDRDEKVWDIPIAEYDKFAAKAKELGVEVTEKSSINPEKQAAKQFDLKTDSGTITNGQKRAICAISARKSIARPEPLERLSMKEASDWIGKNGDPMGAKA